jgi:hypothetical protein
MSRIHTLPGYAADRASHNAFTVQGEQFLRTSLYRVYIGKGAPNEIQDAIWLASLAGLVDVGTLAAYANDNLGIDCGGFVANYWGMGRPSLTEPSPTGSTGFKPRYLWDLNHGLRRRTAAEIQPDDAAIFFSTVLHDNPSVPAPLVNGVYDTTRGSKAFHIGLVSSVTPIAGTTQVTLEIAESSGAAAASGGNGVNVRTLSQMPAIVAHDLVYCPEGNNRIYFVGRSDANPPYPQEHQTTTTAAATAP